jgi:hypothetical protein
MEPLKKRVEWLRRFYGPDSIAAAKESQTNKGLKHT